MEIFVERLKLLRKEENISLVELAKETKLSKSALSYYESGKRIPNALAIIALAKFFNVCTDYLFGLTDIRKIERDDR